MAEATNITNIPLKINNVNIIQNQNELTKEMEKQVQPAPQKTGFFMGMWNKVKSWWVVEEEEYHIYIHINQFFKLYLILINEYTDIK